MFKNTEKKFGEFNGLCLLHSTKVLYQNKIFVDCVLFKKGHSQPLFLHFCLFNTDDRRKDNNEISDIKVCRCLDSNRGPLAYEATALPTELQ